MCSERAHRIKKEPADQSSQCFSVLLLLTEVHGVLHSWMFSLVYLSCYRIKLLWCGSQAGMVTEYNEVAFIINTLQVKVIDGGQTGEPRNIRMASDGLLCVTKMRHVFIKYKQSRVVLLNSQKVNDLRSACCMEFVFPWTNWQNDGHFFKSPFKAELKES